MRQQDELQSLQRYIYSCYPGALTDKPKIFLQRPTGAWVRPIFKIDNPTSPVGVATGQWYFDERLWLVTYMAPDRGNVANGEIWYNTLRNKSKLAIPFWLFNFPYFAPYLTVVTDLASTLTTGSYSVQVVAENDIGQLTRPSAVATIAVTAGQSIKVRIPREPKGWPIGYRFHVYLSGSTTTPTAAHRVGSSTYAGRVDPVFTIAADVPNGAALPPATALMSALPAISEVRYRYMKVIEEQLDAQVLEDPLEDGKFNYVVRLMTRTLGIREYSHDQTLEVVTTDVQP